MTARIHAVLAIALLVGELGLAGSALSQSNTQQQDEAECSQQATQQTGFDPMNPPVPAQASTLRLETGGRAGVGKSANRWGSKSGPSACADSLSIDTAWARSIALASSVCGYRASCPSAPAISSRCRL